MRAVGAIAAIVCLRSATAEDWSYRNISQWSHIGACGEQGDQTPINIVTSKVCKDESLSALVMHAGSAEVEVDLETNEHTWEAKMASKDVQADGAKFTWNGKDYFLDQFHFHSPSENTIDGEFFDMETHFVHKDKDGKALVLAVMLKAGDDGQKNEFLATFWDKFPKDTTSEVPLKIKAPYNDFLPKDAATSYYYFNGSFTTPPCTADTIWVVLEKPVSISASQRDAFRAGVNAIPGNQLVVKDAWIPHGVTMPWNSSLGVDDRPIQPIGARTICSMAVPAVVPPTSSSSLASEWWFWLIIVESVLLVGLAAVVITMKMKPAARDTNMFQTARETREIDAPLNQPTHTGSP